MENINSLCGEQNDQSSVLLEASEVCQLNCPCCNISKKLGSLDKKSNYGFLSLKNFKKFIILNPNIKNIELSRRGEVFLNPEIKEIIKHAYNNGISLSASNGVNFNSVDEELLEYLVKYQFKSITISLDGASDDVYKIYRKGGDFNRVIDNIRRLNELKLKYNSEFPKLTWQFIIFGHNEHELPLAKSLAKSLNMRFFPKLNWDPDYSPVKDKEFVLKESGLLAPDRKEFREKTKREYILPCAPLWNCPQISWDGKLFGCCLNNNKSYGNTFKKSISFLLNSNSYLNLKCFILGDKNTSLVPCFCCNYYRKSKNKPHDIIRFLNCAYGLKLSPVDLILKKNKILTTMIDQNNMKIVLENLNKVLENNIEGDIVEFGCYSGTTSLFIRRLLDYYHSDKKFYVYDSFKGLGEKSVNDINYNNPWKFKNGSCKTSKKELVTNFKKSKLKVPIIYSGWFDEIPSDYLPPKIAFAFFDGDFYYSILNSFNKVYPLLSFGARIVVDDYSHPLGILPGVKKACEDFLKYKIERGKVIKDGSEGIIVKE